MITWLKGNQSFRKKSASILIFVVGAVICGEAIALAIGMNLPVGLVNAWNSFKNISFLFFDILIGSAIIAKAFDKKSLLSKRLLIFAVLSLILHLYREWEYLSDAANSFCENQPLFLVNNLKMLGLIVIVSMCVGKLRRGKHRLKCK